MLRYFHSPVTILCICLVSAFIFAERNAVLVHCHDLNKNGFHVEIEDVSLIGQGFARQLLYKKANENGRNSDVVLTRSLKSRKRNQNNKQKSMHRRSKRSASSTTSKSSKAFTYAELDSSKKLTEYEKKWSMTQRNANKRKGDKKRTMIVRVKKKKHDDISTMNNKISQITTISMNIADRLTKPPISLIKRHSEYINDHDFHKSTSAPKPSTLIFTSETKIPSPSSLVIPKLIEKQFTSPKHRSPRKPKHSSQPIILIAPTESPLTEKPTILTDAPSRNASSKHQRPLKSISPSILLENPIKPLAPQSLSIKQPHSSPSFLHQFQPTSAPNADIDKNTPTLGPISSETPSQQLLPLPPDIASVNPKSAPTTTPAFHIPSKEPVVLTTLPTISDTTEGTDHNSNCINTLVELEQRIDALLDRRASMAARENETEEGRQRRHHRLLAKEEENDDNVELLRLCPDINFSVSTTIDVTGKAFRLDCPNKNCTMTGGGTNRFFRAGTASLVQLQNIHFTAGVAGFGAAIYVRGGNLSLHHCSFTNNRARDAGGVLFVDSKGILSIHASTFVNNTADVGAAIYAIVSKNITISDSTFESNAANTTGGAIFADMSSIVTITSSIFRDNSARISGGAISMEPASRVNFISAQTSFFDNTAETGSSIQITTGRTDINSSDTTRSTEPFLFCENEVESLLFCNDDSVTGASSKTTNCKVDESFNDKDPICQ